jgi:ubiquinone/menaquinone biosynthesis C-methylase UbiE
MTVQSLRRQASNLPFDDDTFGSAVSNLCFHEIADTKDKRLVLREALRVVKKGGSFSFQDLFLIKQVYGEKDDLIATIKSWGIAKVEFIETHNAPFIHQP